MIPHISLSRAYCATLIALIHPIALPMACFFPMSLFFLSGFSWNIHNPNFFNGLWRCGRCCCRLSCRGCCCSGLRCSRSCRFRRSSRRRLGYRTSTFLKDEFEAVCDVKVATEDGSQGTKGTVIDAIEKYGVEGKVIYACGPMPMLKALAVYAEEHGMEAQISLEERMACGIGACLACVCKSKEKDAHSNVHNKRICKDGPVFLSTEVEI